MKSMKPTHVYAASILLVALSLGAGTVLGQGRLPNGTITGVPADVTTPKADPQLRIGPGDLVEVKVFNVPELGQDVRVSDRGDASISLIGSMHLAGLTTVDAQAMIARKFQEGNFVLDPHVSVLIREYGTQGVSVLGEVKNPGVYPVLGTRTLLDVISLAGGTTAYADSQATIQRHADGSVLTVSVTREAKTALAGDVELQPGDKVIIPRAGIIYVLGDVERPGGFLMHDDGRLTMLQALALAGGNTRTASLSSTRLIRRTASGYTDTTISLNRILKGTAADSQLQPDDILYIPNSAAKSVIYRTAPSIATSASTAAIYVGMM